MIVGNNHAVAGNDKSGTERGALAARRRHWRAEDAPLEEPFEEVAQWAFAELLRQLRHPTLGRLRPGSRFLGGDQYNGGTCLVDQIGKAFGCRPRQCGRRRQDRPGADRAGEHQRGHRRPNSLTRDRRAITSGPSNKPLRPLFATRLRRSYVGATALRTAYGGITDRPSAV